MHSINLMDFAIVGAVASEFSGISKKGWATLLGAIGVIFVPTITATYFLSAAITTHGKMEQALKNDISQLSEQVSRDMDRMEKGIIQRLHHRDEAQEDRNERMDYMYSQFIDGGRLTAQMGADHEARLDKIELECARNKVRWERIQSELQAINQALGPYRGGGANANGRARNESWVL